MAKNKQHVDELMPHFQSKLRGLAGKWLRGQSRDYTLQPTAIVNEAYLRLAEKADIDWKSRTHFYAMAAKAMRWVFLDQVRKRHPNRLCTVGVPTTSDEREEREEREVELLALHKALEKLRKLNPRQARVVKLRFFDELKVREVAKVLGLSVSAVEKDWAMARAWLGVELRKELDE